MKINVECIPCYMKQGLQAARFATDDPDVVWQTMRNLSDYTATFGPEMDSHDAAAEAHRIIRETTKCADPYKMVKDKYNRLALTKLPDARRRVEAAANPMDAAARMAIAGNVIDFGSEAFLDLDKTLESIMDRPFAIDRSDAFCAAAANAESVLLIGDNAGEIVFDRLLMERLAPRKIFFAVRGAPILNDATRQDAAEAGLDGQATIIDTGLAVAGAPLGIVSKEFLDVYNSVDVVISKGQANFESLCEEQRENLFFLFTIKCELIARRTRTRVGDLILAQAGKMELF